MDTQFFLRHWISWLQISRAVYCTNSTLTWLSFHWLSAIAGLYPVIGWKIGDELVYLAEGLASDAGKSLEWARSIGDYLMHHHYHHRDICNVPITAKNKRYIMLH